MKNCLMCQKPTKNPKFCSMSCAASYNNALKPKRQLQGSCQVCKKPIPKALKYCPDCRRILHNKDCTIKEAMYKGGNKANVFGLIRTRARTIAKNNNWTTCVKCGYNKHVEVCHKQPIHSFPLDTKLSIINHKNNLIVLCPNCHWEFDHP